MGESEATVTLQTIIIGMTMLFVLALAVILFFIVYQKRLLAQQKKHQQITADYQKELLVIAIESQEKERTRIGKELHDDVGALLITTKLYLSQISPNISTKELIITTEKMKSLFNTMIQGVRNISQDLRPVILDKLGIVEAIQNLAQIVTDSSKIVVKFEDYTTSSIPKAKELNIYRIIQELINNTLKHAMASKISIIISNEEQALKIIYEDDGIGLQEEYLNKKGIGLKNIESRLSVLSGTINFSTQKSGMKATIKIPR